jgi:hypothetical protein
MKTTKWMLLLTTLYCSFFLGGCKDDEGPVNPEELITTLRLTFTPTVGGTAAVLQFRDIDGDGGNAPVITADPLMASASYNVAIEVFNESVTPADTITHEIEDEDEDHQFFFQPAAGLNLTFTYADTDDDGHPVGLSSTAQAGAASTGELTVTLRHEPDKHAAGVEDGDITNAGGETDIEVTFDVVVQ